MKKYFEEYYKELNETVSICQKHKGIISKSWESYFIKLPELYWFCYNIAVSNEIDDFVLKRLYVAIEYLISPLDFMPELIYGPDGFSEDIYFIALTLKDIFPKIRKELIENYWEIETQYDKYTEQVISLATRELPAHILKSVRSFFEDYESPSSPQEIRNLLISDIEEETKKRKSQKLPSQKMDSSDVTDAIQHIDGPCIVFAGPGSGKTRAIEERVFYLVDKANKAPSNILVTTFTNKAANELIVRLRERFSEHKDVDIIMSSLSISTIHSFCFSLLKRYQHRILFLNETYVPIEENDQMLFIYRNSGERHLNLKRFYQYWKNSRMKAGENIYDLGLFDYYAEIIQIYNFLSEEILGSELNTQLEFFKIIKNSTPRCWEDNIIATYPNYWRLLLEKGMMDQSIILSYTEALLKYDQILNEVRKKYKYILVDEYQDTNPIQDRIFRQISGENGNLFVVGDDDQSIYRFRGAEVSNITEFTDNYPQSLIVRLNENRRSSKRIVESTKNLINHNKYRVKKDLFCNHEVGDHISLVSCKDVNDQAEKAAELIIKLKSENIENLSQVAILFRSVKKLGPKFKKALKEKDIECRVTSDKSFFRMDEIKGLLQVFKFIGEEELIIKGRNYLLFFRKAGIDIKDEMYKKIEYWHKDLHNNNYKSLLEFYYRILHDVNVFIELEDDESALGNFGILSELIASFEGGEGSFELKDKLKYFLQYCEMLDGGVDQAEIESGDAVQLMTIHKSKGLQFDYVIIANVIDGYFPLRYRPGPRQRAKGVILKGPEGRNYNKEEEIKSLEEERRIFYVGMTRAAKGIFLLTEEGEMSSFIKELGVLKKISTQPYDIINIPRRIKSSTGDILNITHSEIYDYRFCPGRYKLRHRYRFRGQAIQPLFSGLSLHRSLEVLHRMIYDRQRIDKDILNRIFDRCWIYPFGIEEESERNKVSKIFFLYADNLLQNIGKYRILQIEYPFRNARGVNVLTGKLDLVQENESGQIEIIEFKYNKNKLLVPYTINQLNHYSLAFPQQNIQLSAYYLKEQEKVKVDSIDKKIILEQLDDDFSKIRNKEFNQTPDKTKCKICPIAVVCGEKEL
jgi:DNA helicase-2/ATP-dependent DNA helicase PcrA